MKTLDFLNRVFLVVNSFLLAHFFVYGNVLGSIMSMLGVCLCARALIVRERTGK